MVLGSGWLRLVDSGTLVGVRWRSFMSVLRRVVFTFCSLWLSCLVRVLWVCSASMLGFFSQFIGFWSFSLFAGFYLLCQPFRSCSPFFVGCCRCALLVVCPSCCFLCLLLWSVCFSKKKKKEGVAAAGGALLLFSPLFPFSSKC